MLGEKKIYSYCISNFLSALQHNAANAASTLNASKSICERKLALAANNTLTRLLELIIIILDISCMFLQLQFMFFFCQKAYFQLPKSIFSNQVLTSAKCVSFFLRAPFRFCITILFCCCCISTK